MESGKKRSIELQFEMIQNEKSRLFDTVANAIGKARATSRTSSGPDLSRVGEDNYRLLQLLTKWADAAEELLPGLYAGLAAPPPAEAAATGSVASFRTATGASRDDCSGRVSPNSCHRTPPAPSREPESASKRVTEDLAVHSHAPKLNVSRKSNEEASSIIKQHLLKKKVVSKPSTEAAQQVLEEGARRRVLLSCRDETTGYMYLNLKEDEARLSELSRELTSLALESAVQPSRLPRVGELVMSAWNGAWYRARVTQVTESGDLSSVITMQYIDYGNVSQRPASEVRFLPDKMKTMPSAAYKCKLKNLTAAGAAHLPLQRRLLEALADSPGVELTAQFHGAALPGLYEVTLLSRVREETAVREADVAATLNRVLTLDARTAARLAVLKTLALGPLLVSPRPSPPPPPPPAAALCDEVPAEEKVRGWLATQSVSDPAARPAARAARPAGRGRPQQDINISFPSGGGLSGSRRCRAPAQYAGLAVDWDARPVQQTPSDTEPLLSVMIPHVETPDHFYISRGDHGQFDEFERRLNEAYGGLPPHPEQAFRRQPTPGSYWVARHDDDQKWYRCVVQPEPKRVGQNPAAGADHLVLWVDYGDCSRVPAASFRPMTTEFAGVPLFAARACCAGLYPVDEQGSPLTSYTPEAVALFSDLLWGRPCSAYPVPSESTDACLAVVLETFESGERVSVTDVLLDAGLAALAVPEPAEDGAAESDRDRDQDQDRDQDHDQDRDQWDPMAEDYLSPYNREDVENPGAAELMGREDPEDEVCPIFARGGRCWDGIACRKKHVRGGDLLPARVPVYVDSREHLALPAVDTTVYVKVSAVRDPGCFHVQLPFGAVPAEVVNENYAEYRRRLEDEETLESLAVAMRAAYLQTRKCDYSATCRPALGEIVVARWQEGFHRGRVTDLREQLEPHQLTAEVFLVDHGVTIENDVTELHEIKKQYNLLPYQAVPCTLAYVRAPSAAGWPAAAASLFRDLVQPARLLGAVTSALPDGRLELDLYGERRATWYQLSMLLVERGLAAAAPQRRPHPLPQRRMPA